MCSRNFPTNNGLNIARSQGSACYIDDIIITRQSDAEHLDWLEEVLRRLQRHGIHAIWAKCKLFKSSVNFLGHHIDIDGVHPTTEKQEAIVRAPAQRKIQELRSFLGGNQLLWEIYS